jgi:hypothetical protein
MRITTVIDWLTPIYQPLKWTIEITKLSMLANIMKVKTTKTMLPVNSRTIRTAKDNEMAMPFLKLL